jgi:hypothetical protein
MKFQVPQFIETEVKIVGPFTLKQFLWIAGGGAALFMLYILVQGIYFLLLAIPVSIVFLAFAFLKVDGLPLINYAAYMLSYTINPKKYLYREETQQDIQIPSTEKLP